MEAKVDYKNSEAHSLETTANTFFLFPAAPLRKGFTSPPPANFHLLLLLLLRTNIQFSLGCRSRFWCVCFLLSPHSLFAVRWSRLPPPTVGHFALLFYRVRRCSTALARFARCGRSAHLPPLVLSPLGSKGVFAQRVLNLPLWRSTRTGCPSSTCDVFDVLFVLLTC